jgi:8-oxo-dGTP diphosphatase
MTLRKTPQLTTDCVIFDPAGQVVLVRRKHEPFAGSYALPGGFVEVGETVADACRREVREEAGIELNDLTLVGVYSDPKRDPRGHMVSVAYGTLLPSAVPPRVGSDAVSAEWVKDWRQVTVAFDHAQILADAEAMLRQRRRG